MTKMPSVLHTLRSNIQQVNASGLGGFALDFLRRLILNACMTGIRIIFLKGGENTWRIIVNKTGNIWIKITSSDST